jgi:hypothetical protein
LKKKDCEREKRRSSVETGNVKEKGERKILEK